MRYRVLSIGLPKRGGLADASERYEKRVRTLAQLETVALKEGRGSDPRSVRAAESRALLGAATDRVIALDEHGATFDTRALASHVSELETRGVSRLSLLVGGAEGHDPDLLERADERWSLSKLTMAHELARLVLLEQLYRVESLRAGHPYHRG